MDRIGAALLASQMLIGRDNHRLKPLLQTAVELLPSISPRSLKQTDRQYNISQFANITSGAVSVFLECDDDTHNALRLLELGRGVLASLQLEFRSDISVLRVLHPTLAQQ